MAGQAPKYVQPAEVAQTFLARTPPNPQAGGVLTTQPLPAYNLGRPRGLTNPGNPNPIVQLAPTPDPLLSTLQA